MPTTSIIIATHNRPDLLPRAVDSAREAGTDVEIVVVDDASSDQTADVCRSFQDVKYVRLDRNQGVAGARNVGLLVSTGEYLGFLDDDDVRLPGSLDLQIAHLDREPDAALIYSQAIWGDENGEATDRLYPATCPTGDIFWKLLTRNFLPCGTVIFRRSCLSAVGLLEQQISGLDDWDLWIRMAEAFPVVALEAPVLIWRRSNPSSRQGTSQAARLVSLSTQQFGNYWMKLPRVQAAPSGARQSAWHAFSENMAEHLLWESTRALRHGKLGQPLRNLSVLPRLSPMSLMRIFEHRVLRHSQTSVSDAEGFAQ